MVMHGIAETQGENAAANIYHVDGMRNSGVLWLSIQLNVKPR